MNRSSARKGRWPHKGRKAALDGVDRRRQFQTREAAKPDRKTYQLCGQVRRVLDYVLTGECDDDLLRGLMVQDVRPAPDAARLMVTVSPLDPALIDRSEQILQKLSHVAPQLRYEVSQSIRRRKTPQLMFQVALPSPPEEQPAITLHENALEEE